MSYKERVVANHDLRITKPGPFLRVSIRQLEFMGACLARELAARRWRRDGRKARASEVLKSQTSWKLRGGEKAPRNEEEDVASSQNSWKIAAADDGDGDAWRNAEASDTFARNVDPTRVHVARTGDGAPWVTSQHCFQCALNTIHTCDDFGSDIRTFAGIERKWISAEVSERVHYPRVRYVVAYPPRTPRLPYHDHPGGEEYLVLSGAFCDTNFEDVRAPAFVRYPIGTHHAAMSAPVDERSVILCWWGLMQATSATESGRHVPLDEETMVPKRGKPTVVDGDRLAWPLCGDGVETRVERWRAGADLVVAWARPRKEVVVRRPRLFSFVPRRLGKASRRRCSAAPWSSSATTARRPRRSAATTGARSRTPPPRRASASRPAPPRRSSSRSSGRATTGAGRASASRAGPGARGTRARARRARGSCGPRPPRSGSSRPRTRRARCP